MIADEAALMAFPQLQDLIDLRDAGWSFLPTREGSAIVEIHGLRTWPEGWADAIRVRSATDVVGVRVDSVGGVTWRLEGALTEVAGGLIALPRPGERSAPRLVIGRSLQSWRP